ncbi:hypothetical protein MSAN_02017000 [Mycena sanguinolenta]|uniref:Uncharacterized protein n=1 Tax=Mycena sanguinolenta TaxID=230812 RepID=A0A8H6XJA8_9AGAR|nr:hypothetical protein MSAN_02017000 [Mycena sanguinolenta]
MLASLSTRVFRSLQVHCARSVLIFSGHNLASVQSFHILGPVPTDVNADAPPYGLFKINYSPGSVGICGAYLSAYLYYCSQPCPSTSLT